MNNLVIKEEILKNDLEKTIENILKTIQKFSQAYNLRIGLLNQRIEFIKWINYNYIKSGLAKSGDRTLWMRYPKKMTNIVLKANKNERKLMQILEGVEPDTLKLINLSSMNRSEIKDLKLSLKKLGERGVVIKYSTLKIITKNYTEAILMFYENIDLIKNRIYYEKKMIDYGNSSDLLQYVQLLDSELYLQKRIEKKFLKIGSKSSKIKCTSENLGILALTLKKITNSIVSFVGIGISKHKIDIIDEKLMKNVHNLKHLNF